MHVLTQQIVVFILIVLFASSFGPDSAAWGVLLAFAIIQGIASFHSKQSPFKNLVQGVVAIGFSTIEAIIMSEIVGLIALPALWIIVTAIQVQNLWRQPNAQTPAK